MPGSGCSAPRRTASSGACEGLATTSPAGMWPVMWGMSRWPVPSAAPSGACWRTALLSPGASSAAMWTRGAAPRTACVPQIRHLPSAAASWRRFCTCGAARRSDRARSSKRKRSLLYRVLFAPFSWKKKEDYQHGGTYGKRGKADKAGEMRRMRRKGGGRGTGPAAGRHPGTQRPQSAGGVR